MGLDSGKISLKFMIKSYWIDTRPKPNRDRHKSSQGIVLGRLPKKEKYEKATNSRKNRNLNYQHPDTERLKKKSNGLLWWKPNNYQGIYYRCHNRKIRDCSPRKKKEKQTVERLSHLSRHPQSQNYRLALNKSTSCMLAYRIKIEGYCTRF